MTPMRVIVPTLNIRKAPVEDFSDKSNVVAKLFNGAPFSSVGEKINKLGKWYQNEKGYWAWEVGLKAELPMAATLAFDDYYNLSFVPEKMSWAHNLLEIPFVWNDIQTAGKNVIVGIIDTGVEVSHSELTAAISADSVNIDANGNIDTAGDIGARLKDNMGHGTEMSGMIAARGKQLVYGVAPECKIVMAKVTNDGFGIGTVPVAAALRYMKEKNVDIISMSLTASNNQILLDAFNECINNGIAIFAAIGDEHVEMVDDANNLDPDTFPACYDKCIAVGAFDQNRNVCDFSNRNSHLGLLSPGDRDNILTTSLNNKAALCSGETSIATAITAGCFALIVSYLRTKNRMDLKQQALDILLNTCDDMGPVIGRDSVHGFGSLNIRNAFSRIKTLL